MKKRRYIAFVTTGEVSRLGEMLRLYRAARHIGVREAAAEIGTSAATLSRIERGNDPEARTFIKLVAWMLEKP